jgi:hypothetical protein
MEMKNENAIALYLEPGLHFVYSRKKPWLGQVAA